MCIIWRHLADWLCTYKDVFWYRDKLLTVWPNVRHSVLFLMTCTWVKALLHYSLLSNSSVCLADSSIPQMHRHNSTMHSKTKLCHHRISIANTYCIYDIPAHSITWMCQLLSLQSMIISQCRSQVYVHLRWFGPRALSVTVRLRSAVRPVAAVFRLYQEIRAWHFDTHSPAFLFCLALFACSVVPHCDGLLSDRPLCNKDNCGLFVQSSHILCFAS